MRVVSLIPSATEILFAVGAGDSVVGVTFECDHPPEVRQLPIVSASSLPSGLTPAQIDEIVRAKVAAGEDLYTLDEGALRTTAPDLIVTQDLCAVCAIDSDSVDDALVHLGCRAEVLTLDPLSFTDVLHTILAVGAATGRASAATLVVEELQQRLGRVREAVSAERRPRLALLEWTDPPYCPGHWVPDMIELAGATSALGRAGERSHPVAWPDLASSAPDAIVIAPCGFGLEGAASLGRELIDRRVLPKGVPVWAADADAAFVRPGPRLVDGVEALASVAHPNAIAARPDVVTRFG